MGDLVTHRGNQEICAISADTYIKVGIFLSCSLCSEGFSYTLFVFPSFLNPSLTQLSDTTQENPLVYLAPGMWLNLWEFKFCVMWIHFFNLFPSWCS